MRICILILLLSGGWVKAQQSLYLLEENRNAGEIAALWAQGDYRAILSRVKQFHFSGMAGEQLSFFEASSAGRLQTPDAERKLLNFLELYPYGTRTNEAYFELGSLYYNLKRYQDASEALAGVDDRKLDKDSRDASLFYNGYSLFAQKKLKEARIQFDQLKLTNGKFSPASSYYSGFISFGEKNFDVALQDLKRIQVNQQYADIVPYLIGSCLYKLGKFDELIEYIASLDKGRDIQSYDELLLLVAEAQFSKANFQAAVDGYRTYLESRRSADRVVLYRVGLSYFQLSNFTEASEFFKQVASDKDTTGVFAAYNLGICYLKVTQKLFALSSFQTCARSAFATPELKKEGRYQEAKLLYDLGRPDEAIDKMESFVSAFPDSKYADELRELLSGAYVNANNYRKAIDYIENLQSRTNTTDRAYQRATLYYGFEFYNKGDIEKAVTYFKKSMDYPIDESLVFEASVWIGESLSSSSRLHESFPYYERVVSASSRAALDQVLRARFGLAFARFNSRDYERALINFREFLSKSPKNDPRVTEAQIRLGDCYYVSRSYSLAIDQYKKAAESGKAGSDYALMQTGLMLGILHQNPEGIDALDRMLKKYPSSFYWDEALFHKSQLEFEASRYQQARDGYTRLISSKPQSKFVPYAYVRRAAALFNLKDYDGTAGDYKKVMLEFPGHPAAQDILLPLQEALNLAGRGDEFGALMAQFKQLNPGHTGLEEVEFESARNHYLNQEYSRAITAFDTFLKTYPETSRLTESKFLRAESYYRQKEFEKALIGYMEITGDIQFSNASRVSARIAELESRSSNWVDAISSFKKLIILSTAPKDTYTGWVGLMDGYFYLGNYDSALIYSEKILEEPAAGTIFQHRANLMAGRVYQALGDFDKAKDGYITTINEAQDEFGAQAKYYLAEIHFIQNNHRQCYETILSLNRDFAAYTEWVGRGFLLLAESFAATGEVFQAKATLQSLEKFPLPTIRTEALQRLEKIRLDEEKANLIPADSTDHE